jgi:hypothetical protein
MQPPEPESGTLVLSSLEDVERLRASPTRLRKLDGRLEIRIPGLAPSDRLRLESRLNDLAGVCGCAEGSAAGAIALTIVVIVWIQRDITFAVQSVLTTGAFVIGASLLVKYTRVLAARIQIRRVLDSLLRVVSARVQPDQRGATP